jgi:hypothetical protein
MSSGLAGKGASCGTWCSRRLEARGGQTVARRILPLRRRYPPSLQRGDIYKRAQGLGRINAVDGLERIQREYRDAIVWNALLPVGAQRRDWRQTLVSGGFFILRHHDLQTTLQMADDVATHLTLRAG